MEFEQKIDRFASLFERQQRERMAKDYPRIDLNSASTSYHVKVTIAKKYTRVDFNGSGKYMVDNATEEIFGIKGYGVIHRGHQYGTLDTIDSWDWSGYDAQRKTVAA